MIELCPGRQMLTIRSEGHRGDAVGVPDHRDAGIRVVAQARGEREKAVGIREVARDAERDADGTGAAGRAVDDGVGAAVGRSSSSARLSSKMAAATATHSNTASTAMIAIVARDRPACAPGALAAAVWVSPSVSPSS